MVLLALVGSTGCGGNELKLVPVSGRVTLDGGLVPAPGTLYFLPVNPESGAASRPSAAEFDAEGNYTAQAFAGQPGLMPGEYQISVECWKTPPVMEGPQPVSYLPARYASPAKSGLKLTIAADTNSVSFDPELKSE